jgi:cytochrome P450
MSGTSESMWEERSEVPAADRWSTVDNPYPALARARQSGPVQRVWPLPTADGTRANDESLCVLGFDEVVEVLRDNERFSSEILSSVMGPHFADTIIAMDEPEHLTHRALVAPAFRPKLLGRWEQTLIRRVVDELIDELFEHLSSDGTVDLVRNFTFAFPVRVIARILGLPEADSAQFQRWSVDLLNIFNDWDRGLSALGSLRTYLDGHIADRRREPRDDLTSELILSEVDGKRLGDDAIFAFLRLLLPAGIETTYRSLGNLLLGLLTHTDQLQAVVEQPELRVGAIEEGLRWEAPFLTVIRQSTADTEVAGVEIPRGCEISVFVASANHDERHFSDPESFNIHRFPVPHVTFGSGPHVCLGMHLSRLESRVALNALLERLPQIRLDPHLPKPRVVGSIFRSPDALPVCINS